MQSPETYLTFALAPHTFAVRALCAREIVRAVAIRPLPGSPDIVEGAINYRGSLVPVFDLRSRFGLEAVPLNADQHLVLIELDAGLLALRVDRALDLVSIPVQPVDEGDLLNAAASGFSWLPDGLIVIHDLERFLSPDERAQMDSSLSRAARPSDGEAA
jgi:purine-binding chemotaxis protein CheW